MGVMKGIPIHVSFCASEGISLEILLCVLSAFSAPPSWQMCGNGRVVAKLLLFSKWNLTIPRLLALQMCMLRWGRLHRAAWSGLVTEGQMLSGGGEWVCEERGEWGNLFVGTWVKWKPVSVLPFELKVITLLQLVIEHCWVAESLLLPFEPWGENKRRNPKTEQEKEAIWQANAYISLTPL